MCEPVVDAATQYTSSHPLLSQDCLVQGCSAMQRLALLVGLGFVCCTHALTVKIEPRAEDCYYEKVEKRDTGLKFIFQVTHGGQLDVDVNVYDPTGAKVYSLDQVSEGQHDWIATAKGDYKVCFSNLMARWTPKWVSFYLRQTIPQNAAKIEHLDPIERTVVALSQGLSDMQEEQKQLRAIETLHREAIQMTNTRMMYWSCFEAVVLVVMGVMQVCASRGRKQRPPKPPPTDLLPEALP